MLDDGLQIVLLRYSVLQIPLVVELAFLFFLSTIDFSFGFLKEFPLEKLADPVHHHEAEEAHNCDGKADSEPDYVD